MLIRVLLFMMLFGPGFASAANIFEPAIADRSLIVLDSMFGKLGIFGAGVSDGFATSMAMFNGAALIIGGVLVVYSLIIGTIGTAHDGEMMGKKYSSVWIPLRTVLATSLILPVIGGGSYCLMQLIVGWLIVQGVGLADKIWEAYMEPHSVMQTITVGTREDESTKMAWQMFSSSYCVAALNKIIENDANTVMYHNSAVPVMAINTSAGNADMNQASKWKYGISEPEKFAIGTEDMCGEVNYQFTNSEATDVASYIADKQTSFGKTGGTVLKSEDSQRIASLVFAARALGADATQNMIRKIDRIAERYVNSNGNMPDKELSDLVRKEVSDYHQRFQMQVGVLLQDAGDFSNIKEFSTRDGWVMAGAWFMKMAALQDAAGEIEKIRPTAAYKHPGAVNSYLGGLYDANYGAALAKTRSYNAVAFGVTDENVGKPKNGEADSSGTGLSFGNMASSAAKVWSGSSSVDNELSKYIREMTVKFVMKENSHPMMVMKSLGDWMFTLAKGLIFMNILGSGDFQAIAKMVTFIFAPMLVALGFTLSFIMPMMPFMIWLGCFMGWLILCVEALVAAPIWAVMHLSMSGDDMVGTGAQGYRLVLSLMLRPALMIFGFIAALTIMQVLGQFVNGVYYDVFLMAQKQTDGFSSLIASLAFPAMYLGCMWVIIVKCMEIVHKIPDQLLHWFGGGGAQLAQSAESVGGLQSQAFAATSTTGRMMGSAGEHFYRFSDMKQQQAQTQLMQKQQDTAGHEKNMAELNQAAGSGADSVYNLASGATPGDKDSAVAAGKKTENAQLASKMAGVASTMAAKPGDTDSSGGRALGRMNSKMADSIGNQKMSYGDAVNAHYKEAFDEANGAGATNFAMKSSGLSPDKTTASEALSSQAYTSNAKNMAEMTARLDSVSNNNGSSLMTGFVKQVEKDGGDMSQLQGLVSQHINKVTNGNG